MTPLRAHVRGALVAFAAFAMLVLGFPGLDHHGPNWLRDPDARATRTGLLGRAEVALADFDHHVRSPIERRLAGLQRPLRIAQSWSLYGLGPNHMVRAEVWTDGSLRYRSADPAHTWQRAFLRYRRIRPVVTATCRSESKNTEGLIASLVARALDEDPAVQQLVLRCTRAEWPGTGEAKEAMRLEANAPDWVPR